MWKLVNQVKSRDGRMEVSNMRHSIMILAALMVGTLARPMEGEYSIDKLMGENLDMSLDRAKWYLAAIQAERKGVGKGPKSKAKLPDKPVTKNIPTKASNLAGDAMGTEGGLNDEYKKSVGSQDNFDEIQSEGPDAQKVAQDNFDAIDTSETPPVPKSDGSDLQPDKDRNGSSKPAQPDLQPDKDRNGSSKPAQPGEYEKVKSSQTGSGEVGEGKTPSAESESKLESEGGSDNDEGIDAGKFEVKDDEDEDQPDDDEGIEAGKEVEDKPKATEGSGMPETGPSTGSTDSGTETGEGSPNDEPSEPQVPTGYEKPGSDSRGTNKPGPEGADADLTSSGNAGQDGGRATNPEPDAIGTAGPKVGGINSNRDGGKSKCDDNLISYHELRYLPDPDEIDTGCEVAESVYNPTPAPPLKRGAGKAYQSEPVVSTKDGGKAYPTEPAYEPKTVEKKLAYEPKSETQDLDQLLPYKEPESPYKVHSPEPAEGNLPSTQPTYPTHPNDLPSTGEVKSPELPKPHAAAYSAEPVFD
ncbi:hypothetical protein L0F63_005409 [Massospora cicadina]|nr:hypothetical protein L0F63_005409 [Massospora cicadina]